MKQFRVLAVLVVTAFVALAAYAGDVSVTAANVAYSNEAQFARGTCGGTITVGQAVYRDSADLDSTGNGKIKVADADASAASARVIGIAIDGCAINQKIRVVTKDPNFTPGFAPTPGIPYVAGTGTAGGIALTADLASGDYVNLLGFGKANSKFHLEPFAESTQQ